MENITQEDFDRQRDPTSILKLICGQCKKEFYIRRWYQNSLMKDNKGRGLFCSKTCAQTGRSISEETIEKIRLAQIGIPKPQSGLSNQKHSQWKGNAVGQKALHLWVRRHLPAPELCQICNIKLHRDLANMTGIYNREFKNWKYLCVSCHKKYDYEHGFRKHSEETKRKISIAQIGKKLSEEHKQKIRLGNLRYRARIRGQI